MRDDRTERDKPINRRNTLIALGAIGAIVLVSNLGMPAMDFDFDSRQEDEAEDRIEAAAERLEDSIEANVERSLEAAVERADRTALDEAEMEAAVEDLKDGDPERFIELMEKI